MEKTKPFRRFAGDIGLAGFGLVLGSLLFLLIQATTTSSAPAEMEPAVTIAAPPAAFPGAETPRGAIRSFLDAETAGDERAAFELLSEADRRNNGSAQMWASRRPLGEVQSWEWIDVDALTTTTLLEPGLSLTRGWTPAATTITWAVVDENGWRISLTNSVAEPAPSDPSGVVDAAQTWLQDPARCDDALTSSLNLVTPSADFRRLCTVGGVVSGDSSPVVGRTAAALELAYGAGAAAWAHTVPLEGGLELTLVAVGDRWLVTDAGP